jgi:DNA repair protein RadC
MTEKHRRIKRWPANERPCERLIAYGSASLSDAQLLTIIIMQEKTGRAAYDLAMELFVRFKTLAAIEKAGINEICEVDGVGRSEAAKIKAAIEIGRRYQKPSLSGEALCTSRDVAEYYGPRMKGLKKEIFKCVLLDIKNRVLHEEEISVGGLSSTVVQPRDTFKVAIRESAAGVIFVHNHPSGDAKPSIEDIALTGRLVEAGEVLGIHVLDHVIVGERKFFSFRDKGLIQQVV